MKVSEAIKLLQNSEASNPGMDVVIDGRNLLGIATRQNGDDGVVAVYLSGGRMIACNADGCEESDWCGSEGLANCRYRENRPIDPAYVSVKCQQGDHLGCKKDYEQVVQPSIGCSCPCKHL